MGCNTLSYLPSPPLKASADPREAVVFPEGPLLLRAVDHNFEQVAGLSACLVHPE